MKEPKKRQENEPKPSGAAKPVSLTPLSFEESIDAIFAVPPPPKVGPKTAKKKSTKKPEQGTPPEALVEMWCPRDRSRKVVAEPDSNREHLCPTCGGIMIAR